MNEAKQNLAAAVRDARTELGLSQEKLAEILNIDSRTILNIEAGRGNPKFEKLYPLITYLKIPAGKIFDPACPPPVLPGKGGPSLPPLFYSGQSQNH